ncbi:MAG: hypothetical protein QOG42_971 [Solirubrobacteraceae bacterium]|nr:hypothetical protein [Solirubrobacteraceae bacterium]
MSAFSLAAIHPAYMLVGASPEVRAIVHIRASGLRADGLEAALRLWTPRGATVAAFGEYTPTRRDLRGRAVRLDDRTIACAAGRWSDGAREYELVVRLPPGRAGDEILAARLVMLVEDEVVGRAPIAVTWTVDETLLATRHPDRPAAGSPPVIGELPTGRSPAPRHTLAAQHAAPRCSACDLRAADGDRFCERCGHPLGDVQKS